MIQCLISEFHRITCGLPRWARKDERAVIAKPERLWRSILVDDIHWILTPSGEGSE
jgi:hypothetical protein